jgi:hypothetical protein
MLQHVKEWMTQRWNSTKNSKVGQMLPQWQSQNTTMTTSFQTIVYLREPKKKHKEP